MLKGGGEVWGGAVKQKRKGGNKRERGDAGGGEIQRKKKANDGIEERNGGTEKER